MGRQARLVYLYGFAENRGQCLVVPHGVEQGIKVECVEHDGLRALISLVPSSIYEQAPLEQHLKDPAWLALRVERHNQVLLQALEQCAVAPCRLGTLFRSASAVKSVIARHGPKLAQVLRALEGRQEWSVKAYLKTSGAAILPSSSSSAVRPAPHTAGGHLASRAAGGPPFRSKRLQTAGGNRGAGSAYLLGLVRQRTAEREINCLVQAHAQRITGALAQLAEEMAPLPLRASGDGSGTLFLNLACLVKRGKAGALVSALAKLAANEKQSNTTLTWSGPWPAYSFAADLFGVSATNAG